MMDPVQPTTTGSDERIDWRSCARGALVGLAIIVPTTIVRVVLDREVDSFDDSGWIYPLFLLILIGYFAAGWVAGRARPDSPLTHGTFAGLGVLVAWIPVRIVIWAVREDDRGLFTGRHAALRPGQVFGHLVIAATLGMLGGLMAVRLGRRRTTDAPG
jgi:hypothetical protein